MATHWTDFSGYATPFPDGRGLLFTSVADTTYNAAVAWDTPGSLKNVEIEVRYAEHPSNAALLDLYARMGGAAAAEQSYYTSISSSFNLEVNKYASGTRTNLKTTADAKSPKGNWTRAKFRIENNLDDTETTISAKYWRDSQEEPASWLIEHVDTSPLPAGKIGLGCRRDFIAFDWIKVTDLDTETVTVDEFTGHTLGATPAGYSTPWAARTMPTVENHLEFIYPIGFTRYWWNHGEANWHTEENADALSGGVWLKSAAHSEGRTPLGWDIIDGDADTANVEILVVSKSKAVPPYDAYPYDGDPSDIMGAVARASGPGDISTDKTGYLAQAYFGNQELNVNRFKNSSSATEIKRVSFTTVADTWYCMRFRVWENETNPAHVDIKVKAWRWDEDEPEAWTLEATDTSASAILTGGAAGLYGNWYMTEMDIDRLSIGTGYNSAQLHEFNITGTVTLNSVAVEGAHVYAIDDNDKSFSATTDASGNYTFNIPPELTYHLWAEYDDGLGQSYTSVGDPGVTLTGDTVKDFALISYSPSALTTVNFGDSGEEPVSSPEFTLVHRASTTGHTLMGPAQVIMYVDGATLDSGDGNPIERCLIEWGIRGNNLANVPDRYRYRDDPRPQMAGTTHDLYAADWDENDPESRSSVRGFNFNWLVPEGEWTVVCRVTNPSGLSTVETLAVTVAADTRTHLYVNSNHPSAANVPGGGSEAQPYATLAYAVADRTNGSNYFFEVAGGHTETVLGQVRFNISNLVIQWDRTGARPELTLDSATTASAMFRQDKEHCVLDGLQFNPAVGKGGHATPFTPTLREAVAYVDLHLTGSLSSDYWHTGFDQRFAEAMLVLNCSIAAMGGYGWTPPVTSTWGPPEMFTTLIMDIGPSSSQSGIRTTGGDQKYLNTIYTHARMTDAFKNCIRYNHGSYLHAYGCYFEGGGTQNIGNTNPDSTFRLEHWRIESCTTNGNGFRVTGGAGHGLCVNNLIIISNADAGGTGLDTASSTTLLNVDGPVFSHNTIVLKSGRPINMWGVPDADYVDFVFNNSLIVVDDVFVGTGDHIGGLSRIDDGLISSFANNVWPVFPFTTVGSVNYSQIRRYGGAAQASGDTPTQWQAKDFTDNEQFIDVSVDTSYSPSLYTSVTTEAGVFDDFYGITRGESSSAGHMNETQGGGETPVTYVYLFGIGTIV